VKRIAALSALLALLVAARGSVLGSAARAQACNRCKDTGAISCKKHPRGAAKQEAGSLFCSIAARCPVCIGGLEIDCGDCHQAREAEMEARRGELERFAKAQAAFEKEMGGVPRATLITPHLELTFEVESLTVDRVELDQHELLHLYASRIEKLYADFNEILGLKDRDHRCKRYRVMVWRSPLDQKVAALKFTESGGGAGGSKLLGATPAFTMFRDKGTTPQDEDLHRCLAHNVTHLILSDLFDAVWLNTRKAGWLDEGLAYWFEDRGFGKCTNFCFQEQNTRTGFRSGKWRQPVRGMLDNPRRPPFSETASKQTDEMSLEELALSFSYVDFLLARDAKALPTMVRLLQQKKPTREALQEAYGLGMLEFDGEWKKWVLANYLDR
jgi:hypothetical protein